MGTTSNRSYPYPAGSDAVDVPGDIQALADDVDTDMAAVIAYDTAYVSKSSAYTLVGTDRVIDVTGTTTITLPAAASHTGRVYVVRNTGSDTVTVSGVTGLTLPGKGTATVVSDGSAWSLIDGTYTDESVGRRIFTWDAVNARWQMTHGDTGVREIAVDAGAPLTSEKCRIRRIGQVVYVSLTGTVTGAASNTLIFDLPAGFRIPGNLDTGVAMYQPVGYTLTNSQVPLWVFNRGSTAVKAYWAATGAGITAMWSAPTIDTWPTSLPGTAVGSIPS